MVLVKTSVALFLAVMVLSGCKVDGKKTPEEQTGNVGPITVPKERSLTTAELTIGRRICSSLKHKREFFETLPDMQQQFRFRGELKNCENPNPYNVSEFNVSISNASSSNFEYIATQTRTNYFKDVVTDQTGALNLLCTNLSASDNVSNTMLSGSSYLIVNLIIADGYDRIEISKKSKDTSGNYAVVSAETIAVISQTSQADAKFFGVEKERVRYSVCSSNPKNFSYIKQSWVTAVTPF